MPAARVIARLDVKGPNLVKGIHLEGLRVMGDPQQFAQRYYAEGADEILYVDTVASLYGRNNILEVVRRTAAAVFVPMTVAGGLRRLEDVRDALRSGADKVAINTAAVARPALIREVSLAFGSQCTVLSVPVIAGGGAGTPEHACRAITEAGADAVAIASMLHYGKYTVGEIKARLAQADVPVRSSA